MSSLLLVGRPVAPDVPTLEPAELVDLLSGQPRGIWSSRLRSRSTVAQHLVRAVTSPSACVARTGITLRTVETEGAATAPRPADWGQCPTGWVSTFGDRVSSPRWSRAAKIYPAGDIAGLRFMI